ncbi:phosphoribosyl-aminoimidazole-succinocarboxamide synthase [Rhizodiscina lignyota]|uniref:Phosphoribosylaminoimidazole-succinocarboxamide synthase n=1 Tax=Rhizodiscina lignyota TaxID=1504668 RepID=A0A9P4IPW9_9PEZI|nr:phosphoribosyl-aminoimidazole-succinocarboxamide synthase [Rhizodiscina lignyota]
MSSDSAIIDSALVGEGKPFRDIFAKGKVRDVYLLDSSALLFIATDRISAYDVILSNGIPQKGSLLTSLSAFWFAYLSRQIPGLKTHLISIGLPPSVRDQLEANRAEQLSQRSMVVRKLEMFPLESIVRGYITGSAWKEYQTSGTVHGISIRPGMKESERFDQAIWTPSTKAEVGDKDENISPAQAAALVGKGYAAKIEKLSLQLYETAHAYALERGIIIADTKFEFAKDENGEVVVADEVLTPDSSRFWPLDKYEPGRSQESYDKQYLRDWLTKSGLKGKDGVNMPEEIVEGTRRRYEDVSRLLT